jgi:PKHD-type hydroxylase
MQMTTANFLSEAALSDVRDAFAKANFVDGRESAGWAAKDVKRNLQARAGDPAPDAARSLIGGQLATNPLFQLAIRPKRISPLLFVRYENTMAYGAHVNDAIMGDMRTDVSFTDFLDAPDS